MHGFGNFNFFDANNIFEDFFKHTTFDSQDDEDFFSIFLGKKNKNGKKGFGFGFGSLFDDSFKDMGFGSGSGSFGQCKSMSTTTKIINGKKIVTKKTTITKPDGTK
jgi:hypothetical protein